MFRHLHDISDMACILEIPWFLIQVLKFQLKKASKQFVNLAICHSLDYRSLRKETEIAEA